MTPTTPAGRHFRPARPRTAVDLEVLLDVVGRAAEQGAGGRSVEITVEDPHGTDPVVVLREQERVTSIGALDLAARMSRDGVDPTPPAIAEAFEEWVDGRPATDDQAQRRGLATLASLGPDAEPRWKVLVPRSGGSFVEWVPTWRTSREAIAEIRAAALRRAAEVEVTPVAVGDVVIWAHLAAPSLSTAVLLQGSALQRRHLAADTYLVLAPDRPVAAAGRVAAARLTEESSGEHVVLPLARLTSSPAWPAPLDGR